jgi:hypothetical protein
MEERSMSNHTNGHINRKLRELAVAGAKGVPAWEWRQSQVTLPILIDEGLAVRELRVEPVEYIVITGRGRALLRGEP